MADTLPQVLTTSVLADITIVDELAKYPVNNSPAFFQGRAPSDHEGHPYLVFQLTESQAGGGDQHYLKRSIELRFDAWDLNAGHSYATLQTVARALVLLFDRQRIIDGTDYEGMRAFLQTNAIEEEQQEQDNVLHMVVIFTLLGFRKYLQTFLTTS